MQIFFKIATDNIFRWQPAPVPSNFDDLPYPRVRGTLGFFFNQNDHKECKRDHLDARGHLVLRFGVIGDKPSGGNHLPLGRRGLKQYFKPSSNQAIFCNTSNQEGVVTRFSKQNPL